MCISRSLWTHYDESSWKCPRCFPLNTSNWKQHPVLSRDETQNGSVRELSLALRNLSPCIYTSDVDSPPPFLCNLGNRQMECQPEFCSEDNPAKYPSSTCGIYFLGKFKEMYNITENWDSYLTLSQPWSEKEAPARLTSWGSALKAFEDASSVVYCHLFLSYIKHGW